MSVLLRRVALCLLFSTLILFSLPTARSFATGPCDSVTGDPHPPTLPPEPLISGAILDAASYTGVSGVTVQLYRCQGQSAVYVAQTTTPSSGAYSFGNLSQNWYFVEVALTGPLAGKSPASGTSNPTSLIEVGSGVLGLSLAFE